MQQIHLCINKEFKGTTDKYGRITIDLLNGEYQGEINTEDSVKKYHLKLMVMMHL